MMTLSKLISKLNAAASNLSKNGIDPSTIRVVIHHSNRECTGDISRIQAFKNITLDEIPYDVGGTSYTGSDYIKIHDDVVIIEGE